MKNLVCGLLFIISNSLFSQILDKKASFLSKELIFKNEKVDIITATVHKIQDQFKFENKYIEIKLKRVSGYEIQDIVFEEFSLLKQIKIYDKIFEEIEATSFLYATIIIRI